MVEYQRREECYSHETYEDIAELDRSVRDTTLRDMLGIIRAEVSENAILEFNREIVISFACRCRNRENAFKLLGKVSEDEALCPFCGELRTPELTHSVCGDEPFLDMMLHDLGVPLFDIVCGRDGLNMKYFEFGRDKSEVLWELV